MRGPRAGWGEWVIIAGLGVADMGYEISHRGSEDFINVWIVMALQQTVLNVGINSNLIVKNSAI